MKVYSIDNKTTDSVFFPATSIDLLEKGLSRSYKERFEMATRLYKAQQTMKKARISHKPFPSK